MPSRQTILWLGNAIYLQSHVVQVVWSRGHIPSKSFKQASPFMEAPEDGHGGRELSAAQPPDLPPGRNQSEPIYTEVTSVCAWTYRHVHVCTHADMYTHIEICTYVRKELHSYSASCASLDACAQTRTHVDANVVRCSIISTRGKCCAVNRQ